MIIKATLVALCAAAMATTTFAQGRDCRATVFIQGEFKGSEVHFIYELDGKRFRSVAEATVRGSNGHFYARSFCLHHQRGEVRDFTFIGHRHQVPSGEIFPRLYTEEMKNSTQDVRALMKRGECQIVERIFPKKVNGRDVNPPDFPDNTLCQ